MADKRPGNLVAMRGRQFFGLNHTSRVAPIESRPKCQACGATLKMHTYPFWPNKENPTRWLPDGIEYAVAWSTAEIKNGYLECLNLWFGIYGGCGADESETPLFCRLSCALLFAEVAYKSGARIKRISTGTLTR